MLDEHEEDVISVQAGNWIVNVDDQILAFAVWLFQFGYEVAKGNQAALAFT